MTLISIIIPIYNVEAYLVECLDSVYNQLTDECELIVVNDGSTDKSRQLLADFQKTHPDLTIVDQTNKGASTARNTGLFHAKGEFIYFLDSDDYLMPGAVAEILKCVLNSTAQVIHFNAMVNGDKIFQSPFKVSNLLKSGVDYMVDFYADNKYYPNVNPWLYVYNKTFLEKNNIYFKNGLFHEDLLFTMYIFYYAEKMCGYNISLCSYRQYRNGSLSMNIKLKNLIDRSSICRELNDFFEANKNQNTYFYNLLFHQYLFNNIQAYENGYLKNRKLFFNKLDKAIMKKGIIDEYEYKLWLLSTINLKLALNYYNNNLTTLTRRLLNSIASKLYNKNFA